MFLYVLLAEAEAGGDLKSTIITVGFGLLFGALISYLLFNAKNKAIVKKTLSESESKLSEQYEAKQKDLDKEHSKRLQDVAKKGEKERRNLKKDIQKEQTGLDKLSSDMESREERVQKKEKTLEQQERDLHKQEEKSKNIMDDLQQSVIKEKEVLLNISNMTEEEAQEVLLERLQNECENEQADIIHRVVSETKKEANKRGREIIAEALVRIAAEQTAASTVSTFELPSEDLKGRIIGREGRNIKAFERITGIDVIVDDTPGLIILSGFDAIRREIALMTMKKLLSDGRIYPARIEEVTKSMRKELEKSIEEIGRKTVLELNIQGLNSKFNSYIGRYNYKVLKGQNLLKTAVVLSDLCSLIGAHFDLDINTCKIMGLLVHLGRMESQELEGTAAHAGAQVARRYGAPKEVINAIASSENGVEAQNLYAVILQVVLKMVNARPGSTSDQIERLIRRMEDIEGCALDLDGVKQAFSVQSGNELRVVVNPEKINDKMATKLARDIAKKIEKDLSYPGSITVNLLREARSVSYAK
jgi:ribonuclease Y